MIKKLDTIDEIIDLYKRGWSMDKLADRFGYCKATIWKILHINNVKVRKRGGPNHIKKAVEES